MKPSGAGPGRRLPVISAWGPGRQCRNGSMASSLDWPPGKIRSDAAAGLFCNQGLRRSSEIPSPIPALSQMHIPPCLWFSTGRHARSTLVIPGPFCSARSKQDNLCRVCRIAVARPAPVRNCRYRTASHRQGNLRYLPRSNGLPVTSRQSVVWVPPFTFRRIGQNLTTFSSMLHPFRGPVLLHMREGMKENTCWTTRSNCGPSTGSVLRQLVQVWFTRVVYQGPGYRGSSFRFPPEQH